MLAGIRASLEQSRAMLVDVAARTPHAPPPFVHPPQDDLPAQFAAELAKLEGYPHRCADDTQALDAIRVILQRQQATSVVAWDRAQIGLPGLDALLAELGAQVLDGDIIGFERAARLRALEPVLVCISGADAGIAESGTIMLRSGTGCGRLASLIAPVHIAVLRRGNYSLIDMVRASAHLQDDRGHLDHIWPGANDGDYLQHPVHLKRHLAVGQQPP